MNAELYASSEHVRPDRSRDVDAVTCLGLLTNERSQEILAAIGDDRLTAGELADRTTVPVSTLYRHLAALVDAELLDESVRLQPDGRHTAQYARAVREIVVSVADDITVRIES